MTRELKIESGEGSLSLSQSYNRLLTIHLQQLKSIYLEEQSN